MENTEGTREADAEAPFQCNLGSIIKQLTREGGQGFISALSPVCCFNRSAREHTAGHFLSEGGLL